MRKLAPVEEAKTLFNVAKEWSVWRWLTDKKLARRTADRANEALDALEREVKGTWSEELQKAYKALEEAEAAEAAESDPTAGQKAPAHAESNGIDPRIKATAERVREADNIAYNAHLDAEDMFDEAERKLSADLARKAAIRAIESWELHEAAIRKAEVAGRSQTRPAD